MMSAVHRLLARLRRDDEGAILIETAFVISMLVAFLVVIYDIGSLFVRQMQITNAVRAGTQYALVRKPIAGDTSQINAAVLLAAPDGAAPVVTADIFCSCANGEEVSCEMMCEDGSEHQYFVEVTYEEVYSLLLAYPGLNKNMTLRESSVMRLN